MMNHTFASTSYNPENPMYPNEPGFKEKGGTSEEAAQKIDAKTLREAVLVALKAGPATADETADSLGKSVLAIRPRFTELKKLGLVYKTAQRRPNRSGIKARVWDLVSNIQTN